MAEAGLVSYDVVVPTVGRPSLGATLAGLAAGPGPLPGRVLLVDDRPGGGRPGGGRPGLEPGPLRFVVPPLLDGLITVVPGRATGPAAARNAGWRAASADWVAFLDDDVVPAPGWRAALAADLAAAGDRVAGSQGQVRVPLPGGRRPTDWERNVAGLEDARWATADLAYRRTALEAVGGFDERFRRAYREDTDLGLRLVTAGWEITRGERRVDHPVRPAPALVSLGLQRGNADDVLAFALHGPGWRERGGVPHGRRPRNLAVTVAGLAGLAALAAGRRRLALTGLGLWTAGTAELAWARIAPGPRTGREVAAMLASSVALPAAASWHAAAGVVRHRRLLAARLTGRVPRLPGLEAAS
jgi:hypothetical protein